MSHLLVFCSFIFLTVSVFSEKSVILAKGDGQIIPPYNISEGKNHTDSHSSHHKGGLHVAAVAYAEVRDPLIFTIVLLLAGISKLGYHHANILSSRIPESCILIILGTGFGAVIHFSGISKDLPEFFKPHEFFIFLLPPIILEAAFSLHDRTFTENLGSILLFAVLGTVLACIMLGGTLFGLAKAGAMGEINQMSFMEIMVFCSLIVAVDPVAVLAVFNEIGVNHVLYFLVFGESLLNDGVTVVLYKVFQAYNVMDEITYVHVILGIVKFFVVCLGGFAIGVLAGLASALLTKLSKHVKVVQPIIIFTMAYLGFLMAELFEFSGIISIIGCGLTQVHYSFHNISDKSRTTIKYFTKVISSANEIIIFLFLGLSLVTDHHEWHTGFTLWTIFFCLVYRFIIIFCMSAAINWLDIYRVRKIGLHEQFMIAYGGLRGAVCFSLVALLDPNDLPSKNMFVTTTLAVIVFTVFVQGITIKPLVYLLQIKLAPEKCNTMCNELNAHVTDRLMAGIEDIIGDHGKNHLREKIEFLDEKYIKPLLQIAPDPRNSHLRIFFENLLLKEHYKFLKLSGAKTPEIPHLPHVNTEFLLSTLVEAPTHMQQLPILERTEIEPSSRAIIDHKVKSAPSSPVVAPDMDQEVLFRRNNRKRSMSVPAQDINVTGLRNLLISQRNSRMVSKYDKNLTAPEEVKTELCKKANQNKRLMQLMSKDGELSAKQRRKSWSESDAHICEERYTLAPKKPPRHAVTVDLGNTVRQGTYDPLAKSLGTSLGSPCSMGSPLGSVFEEDETHESQPMLDSNGRERKGSSSSPSKHKLERQICLDTLGTSDDTVLSEEDKQDQTMRNQRESGKGSISKKGDETSNV